MVRSTLIFIFAAACLAQTPKALPKPPEAVDQALRARVLEFFHYHVTGEFRKGEALVAEDSKDLYYNRNKPRYLQVVEIARVDYNEDFTKATATVMVVSPQMIPGWEGMPTIPIPTAWKIENGKWCYYVEPETLLRTPFGSFPLETVSKAAPVAPGFLPGSLFPSGIAPSTGTPPAAQTSNPMAPAAPPPAAANPNPPSAPSAIPSAPDPAALAAIAGARELGMSPAAIPGAVAPEAFDKIKPDKSSVTLTAGGAETVTFANTAPDGRSLLMLGSLAGVQAKFDRTAVGAGEKAVLTLQAGKDAKGGMLNVVIPQTGEMFAINVTVK